jgi:hypothetical protein
MIGMSFELIMSTVVSLMKLLAFDFQFLGRHTKFYDQLQYSTLITTRITGYQRCETPNHH